jgi:hypothetical protein
MKRTSVLLLLFALGCGGSQPTPPDAGKQVQPAAAPLPTGKPNAEEAIASIREYFTDPGSGTGYLRVDVDKVSEPVAAPSALVPGGGEAWAYSVTMTCENVVGDRQHNKNWLIVIGRDRGKATVKDYFNDLTRMANSPVGKEWFAKNGFGEPTIE